jgi:hypothetical protein
MWNKERALTALFFPFLENAPARGPLVSNALAWVMEFESTAINRARIRGWAIDQRVQVL